MQHIHLLDVLGVKRFEDLLFKCNRSLIGVAENVESFREECAKCGQPNLIAWTYYIGGEQKIYRLSDVCTSCVNGRTALSYKTMKQDSLDSKWFWIKDNDNAGFKNYETYNDKTLSALKSAKEYTLQLLNNKLHLNLILTGSTGTGKTHLAKAIGRTLKEKGMNVAYISAERLFQNIIKTFGNDRHKEKLMNEFAEFDLMIIDDVGLETKKTAETSWTVTEWTKLVEAREGRATIYTTNFDDDALKDVIGARAYSRMYMDTKFIDLFTEDYRKKKVAN